MSLQEDSLDCYPTETPICVYKEGDTILHNLVLRLRGGSSHARNLGLVPPQATCVALADWNGEIPGIFPRKGLPMKQGDLINIGRVVNSDWFQSYKPDDESICGYIPRAYVTISEVYDKTLAEDFTSSARNDSESSDQLPLPSAAFLYDDPSIAYDEYRSGRRISVKFDLNRDNSLDITLSFSPTPNTRFANAEFVVQLEDGQINSIHPEIAFGPESEVKYTDNKTTGVSASAAVSAGGAPATAQASASWTLTHQRHIEYSRRTKSKVQGSGVKTKKATWILQEDPGQAGQHGLQATERLSLTLSVRPSIVRFSLKVLVISGDGAKHKPTELTSGFLTQKLSVSSSLTPPVPPEPKPAGFITWLKEKFHNWF